MAYIFTKQELIIVEESIKEVIGRINNNKFFPVTQIMGTYSDEFGSNKTEVKTEIYLNRDAVECVKP